MKLNRFAPLLAFALMSIAPALAQPQPPSDYITGSYRISLTLDGTKYRIDVAGYRGSWVEVAGDSVVLLNLWIAPDAVERAGLPALSTLKGKQSSLTRLFKETTSGQYQKLTIANVSIAGLSGSSAGPLVLQLHVGKGATDREERSGVATAGQLSIPGVRSAGSLSIPFRGEASPLGKEE